MTSKDKKKEARKVVEEPQPKAPVVEEMQPEKSKPKTAEENLKDFSAKLDKIAADLQMILREGHEITTVKGLTLTIPPVTGLKEKAAIKLVVAYFRENTDLIKKIFGSKEGEEGEPEITTEDIISFIIDGVDNGYEKAQELVSLLIDKDVEWVDANLLAADLLGVILPFTKAEAKPIMSLFSRGNALQTFGRKMKEAKAQMLRKAGKVTSG